MCCLGFFNCGKFPIRRCKVLFRISLGLFLFLFFATSSALSAPLVPKSLNFRVDGVEKTQGIQYYKSKLKADNPNPDARPQADNSIPMIAYRNTGLRYYFDTILPESRKINFKITGVIEVTIPGEARAPLIIKPHGVALPMRASQIKRGNKDHTLNFLIPAEYSHGTIQVKLKARLEAPRAFSVKPQSAENTTTITFEQLPDLDVAELRVRQVAPPPNSSTVIAAESPGGYVKKAFSEDALKLLPVSKVRVSSLLFSTETPPTNPVTFHQIENNKPPKKGENSPVDDDKKPPIKAVISEGMPGYAPVYFAILPTACNGNCDPIAMGTPIYRGVAAFNNVLNSRVVVHELGHAMCGLRDIQGNNDPKYPQYQMEGLQLARQSIGEYGYDPVANKVYGPNSTDFMVAPPRIPSGDGFWISPFHYKALLECMRESAWSKECSMADDNYRCW